MNCRCPQPDSGENAPGKMLSTTFTGVAPAAGRGGAELVATPGSVRQSNDRGGARVGREISEGIGVQEWPDGSKYEGESINGLKHGKGRYSWTNGEVVCDILKN